jgi:hypothetical protein
MPEPPPIIIVNACTILLHHMRNCSFMKIVVTFNRKKEKKSSE